MGEKFTLRDFLVYWLTGNAAVILWTILFLDHIKLLVNSHAELLKNSSTIIVFVSIPALYLLGQLVQGIDLLIYRIGKKLKLKNNNKIIRFINYLINGHRISGSIRARYSDNEAFWTACAKLQAEKKFSHCEYWYLMNDLFKGVYVTTFSLFFLAVYKNSYSLSLIFFLLAVVAFVKARMFARNFVSSVYRTTSR